nr:hypothetical protein [Candidatus Sigynarchaeota archaeon]
MDQQKHDDADGDERQGREEEDCKAFRDFGVFFLLYHITAQIQLNPRL